MERSLLLVNGPLVNPLLVSRPEALVVELLSIGPKGDFLAIGLRKGQNDGSVR